MYLQVLLWAWCTTRALYYRHLISSLMLRLWRAFVILWIVIMIIVLQICVLVQLMSITSSCQGIVCLIWLSQYFVDKTYSKHTKECFCFAAFGYFWGILDLLCGNDNYVITPHSKSTNVVAYTCWKEWNIISSTVLLWYVTICKSSACFTS